MNFLSRDIKFGVWCATSATRLVNPDVLSVVNLSSFANKLRKLQKKFLPLFFNLNNGEMKYCFFQPDCATDHTASNSMTALHNIVVRLIISCPLLSALSLYLAPWDCVFLHCSTALVALGLLAVEVSRSHSDTPHAVGFLRTSDYPEAETSN
jgi:hypothetical protein